MKTRNRETHRNQRTFYKKKKHCKEENYRDAICRFQRKYSGYNDQSVSQR